jgi:exonuclease III
MVTNDARVIGTRTLRVRSATFTGNANNQVSARPRDFRRIAQPQARTLKPADPDSDNLFTWWAPWRNLRQRNIGWRIAYVLASGRCGAFAVHAT